MRTLEGEAKRELLHPRDGKRGAVLSQRAAGELIVESSKAADRVGVETYRIGGVEYFPCELEANLFVQLPSFRKTRVGVEIAIATVLVPLSSFTRIGETKRGSRSHAII